MKFLATEITDSRIDDFAEVVRQNFTRQAHGNTLGTLRKEQRELGRERDRLLVGAIVTPSPLGDLVVEHHFKGKLRQARLDVTASRSTVASENVTPVTLRIYQQPLLTDSHQSRIDGGIAVWVIVHGVAHDTSHLSVVAVVALFHHVHDAALHRFQAIFDVWHRTLQNHIAGVVEKPILVHTRELQFLVFGQFVGRMGRSSAVVGGHFFGLHIFHRSVGCLGIVHFALRVGGLWLFVQFFGCLLVVVVHILWVKSA